VTLYDLAPGTDCLGAGLRPGKEYFIDSVVEESHTISSFPQRLRTAAGPGIPAWGRPEGVLMKNFVQSGEWALTVIAPTGGVVAGAIVIVGSIVGVAKGTASAGAEVEIRHEGVYDLAKLPADALAAGAIAKVHPAAGIVGAAGTKSIGWIVAEAGAGSTTARVRLVPGIA
jgi:predicted RecA/RadA family phage recombinase